MKYIRVSDEEMEWNKVEGNVLIKDNKRYRIVGFEQTTYNWILVEE